MARLSEEQIHEWADSNLRSLRGSFADRKLPEAWDRELAALPRDNAMQELVYYAQVKHFYRLRYEELNSKGKDAFTITPEKARAMRDLLRRTPIRVQLAGRSIDVTFRGRAALLALAEHDLARRQIDRDLEQLAELAAETIRRQDAGRISRGHARRRLRTFQRIHGRYYAEYLRHTRVILANALTPDGREATEDQAPEWWSEVTAEEEMQLLIALFRVGPERLERLGELPATRSKDRTWVEDFGFWSLYSYFERDAGLVPGAFHDQDAAQFSAWIRAGALYYPPSPRSGSREMN